MGRLALAFIRRDFLMEMSYTTAFIMKLIFIFGAVPIIYFVSQVFGANQTLGSYSGQHFQFLLIGFAFQDYVTFSQSSFNTSIREHQLMGTLEIVMLSPTPVALIPIFSSLWGYISTSVRFMSFLLVGMLFGLDGSRINISALLAVTVLAIFSMSAVAMVSASVVILVKRGGEIITTVLTGATVLLSGVLYPVGVLPAPLQRVAELLPFTHALEGMRKAVLLDASLADVSRELAILAIFALILFPLGVQAFQLAVQRAKVLGTLGQY